MQTNEPSKLNPWKGIKPWFKSPNDIPEGFVELEASKNNVEERPPNLPIEDKVQEVNMGTPDNLRHTFVNAHIKRNELEDFVYLLHEFVDCFAWTYAEMP